jgi:hypothetical protein
MDQQTLVAIGQTQDAAAPCHQAFEAPGAWVAAVQYEAEIACMGGVAGQRYAPVRRKARVGVQQQQPGVSGGGDTGGDLGASAQRGGQDAGAVRDGLFAGAVGAAAIDDDDLAVVPQRGQGPRQEGGGVQCGDDDGEVRRSRWGGFANARMLHIFRLAAKLWPVTLTR